MSIWGLNENITIACGGIRYFKLFDTKILRLVPGDNINNYWYPNRATEAPPNLSTLVGNLEIFGVTAPLGKLLLSNSAVEPFV